MFQIKLIVIYKVMMPLTFFPARIIPSLKLSNYSWPSLAFVGRHWLLNGYCGPSWACVGLRWPSLATVGFRGPALAAVGCCGPSWACVGLRCVRMVLTTACASTTPCLFVLIRFLLCRFPFLFCLVCSCLLGSDMIFNEVGAGFGLVSSFPLTCLL